MNLRILTIAIVGLGLSGCTLPDIYPDKNEGLTVNTTKSQSKRIKEVKEVRTSKYDTYWNASEEKKAAYKVKMTSIAKLIPTDPNYNRLALDTRENKDWFRGLTYLYWDKQITTNRFIDKGLEKYPNNLYEFNFIVKNMD